MPSTPVIPAPPLTELTLQNAKYHSPDWGDVPLVEGVYLRPPQAPGESAEIYKTEFREPAVFGDLNADGAEDAIVFLSTQNGGTGHFVELAAVLNRDGRGEPVHQSLGDRAGIEAARMSGGYLTEAHVEHPMRCAAAGDGGLLDGGARPSAWRGAVPPDDREGTTWPPLLAPSARVFSGKRPCPSAPPPAPAWAAAALFLRPACAVSPYSPWFRSGLSFVRRFGPSRRSQEPHRKAHPSML
jgi:hypothetical protein